MTGLYITGQEAWTSKQMPYLNRTQTHPCLSSLYNVFPCASKLLLLKESQQGKQKFKVNLYHLDALFTRRILLCCCSSFVVLVFRLHTVVLPTHSDLGLFKDRPVKPCIRS